MARDVELCKYYNCNQARKNGKACMYNPEIPERCWEWYCYGCSCDKFEEEDLDELIAAIEE